MTYTKKQFLEDVAKEATALKEHATKEEIAKLNFENLYPRSASSCIYGQMTGNCFSARAAELIHSCCKRYFKSHDENENLTLEEISHVSAVIDFVNGTSVEGVDTAAKLHKHRNKFVFHFSSIEAYIMEPHSNNANLIAFLKGERKDLVL